VSKTCKVSALNEGNPARFAVQGLQDLHTLHRLDVLELDAGVLSFKVEDDDLAEARCYRFQVIDRSQGGVASEIQPFEVLGNL